MTDYSQEQFKNDLSELTSLINKYNAEGGKRKRKSPKKRSAKKSKSPKKLHKKRSAKRSAKKSKSPRRKSHRKSGGAKKGERFLDAEGNPIRSFRVLKVNGRDVSGNKAYAQRYYKGTRKNNTPGKAADHAFPKLCVHSGLRNKNTCKVTFTLLETTKGGQHKEHGPYAGKYVKLVEPRKVTRRNPKTGKVSVYTVHYKPQVSLASNK